MKKLRHPRLVELARMTAPARPTAWLVTNQYGNFWIEIEPPVTSKSSLLPALAKAGWAVDNTIKLKTRTLLIRAGRTRDDELTEKEGKRLIAKATRDFRKFGLNTERVDRGI